MQVAVCVITCQRPRGLETLLYALGRLSFAHGRPVQPDVEIIVVDNDEAESARCVCETLAGELPWPVRYLVEPRRGIPFARNRAVAAASGSDFLAFIDDDEWPDPDWLDELLRVQAEFAADVVTGPTLRELPDGLPQWMIDGRVFDTARFATGERRPTAYTSNVLVRSDLFEEMVEEMGQAFDERMAHTGGSDAHFFRRVHLRGHTLVWADDAVVRERLPASRTTLRWVLQRSFRIGNSRSFVETDIRPTMVTRLRLVAWAAWLVTKGVLLCPLGLVTGRRGFVRSLRHLCTAAGTVTGLVGHRYEEYRTIHGD